MDVSMPDRDAPLIRGTEDADVIRVERSVTFDWVPDGGDAHYLGYGYPELVHETREPSTATGWITFQGVSSSEAFTTALVQEFQFRFTVGGWLVVDPTAWAESYYSYEWSWDPQIEAFISGGFTAYQGYMTFTDIGLVAASFYASRTEEWYRKVDRGHWALASDPIDATVEAGGGDDVVFGGQGDQTILGGDGGDVVRLGRGSSRAFGEAGNDELHGGMGRQVLDGGPGDDILQGGRGTQVLRGEDGDDELRGGSGTQTLLGGGGGDLLWGGVGTQVLRGDAGRDELHAGIGQQTLLGGAGRDVFVFHGVGQARIADFRAGQDLIRLDLGAGAIGPEGLAGHLLSDAAGDAVLDFGAAMLSLAGFSEQRVRAHLEDYFVLTGG